MSNKEYAAEVEAFNNRLQETEVPVADQTNDYFTEQFNQPEYDIMSTPATDEGVYATAEDLPSVQSEAPMHKGFWGF